MNIFSMNFIEINHKYLEVSKKLDVLDAKIESLDARIQSDLLLEGRTSCRKQSALSELRSLRILERSRLLDISSHIRILKREFYESRFINRLMAMNHPCLAEIIASIPESEGVEVEITYLVQQRLQAYRKLKSCIKEMDSIRYQQYRLNSNQVEAQKDDWEARLGHAMSKSNRYFARQCGKIKAIRQRLVSLSFKRNEHSLYQAAVNILGFDEVNEIAGRARLNEAA